jgi:hypothetical protein
MDTYYHRILDTLLQEDIGHPATTGSWTSCYQQILDSSYQMILYPCYQMILDTLLPQDIGHFAATGSGHSATRGYWTVETM